MPEPMNRRMVIASMPEDRLTVSDFAIDEAPIPDPTAGEVLCRTTAITIGAGQRAGLQGSASYAGAPQVGGVMGGSGLATVEQSNAAGFAAGDLVRAPTGWQEYSVQPAAQLSAVEPGADPAHLLGPLGTNGLTAYFGLVDVGGVEAGQTVVVSAAAGSVGHLVGQMAKAGGARVVGVAGSDEKCRLLTGELGFDAAVNRRSDDFRNEFKAATPDRIDIYFDNTGGPILESALFRMAVGGRIVCCGVASQYDTSSPAGGPRGVPGLLVNNRVRMEGFLVFDYADRYGEAREVIGDWITAGRLSPRVTTYDGLEAAPQAFVDLLAGTTIGTTIVTV
ncbi:MAG: NADP-dependent oxidoreductase [Acidimicrobiales bacterium]